MNLLLVPVIYLALLIGDAKLRRRKFTRRERVIYVILGAIAVASAVPASVGLDFDQVGASLSGMVSLFMH